MKDPNPPVLLPSAFQPGDECIVRFGELIVIDPCQISAVRFTKNRVLYDVSFETHHGLTSIENVGSLFVHKPEINTTK